MFSGKSHCKDFSKVKFKFFELPEPTHVRENVHILTLIRYLKTNSESKFKLCSGCHGIHIWLDPRP